MGRDQNNINIKRNKPEWRHQLDKLGKTSSDGDKRKDLDGADPTLPVLYPRNSSKYIHANNSLKRKTIYAKATTQACTI